MKKSLHTCHWRDFIISCRDSSLLSTLHCFMFYPMEGMHQQDYYIVRDTSSSGFQFLFKVYCFSDTLGWRAGCLWETGVRRSPESKEYSSSWVDYKTSLWWGELRWLWRIVLSWTNERGRRTHILSQYSESNFESIPLLIPLVIPVSVCK
jgi:hypothetical protein